MVKRSLLSSTPAISASLRLRWIMISFAFSATVLNYLDRQILSFVKASPEFQQAVPVSDELFGILNACFMGAYALANGLSGPLIDRVGTKIGYAACMVWWSLAGIAHIFARGPWSLGACRVALGLGEAGNWPAAAKLVGEWFPSHERALASGIFNSGASIGAILSPLLIVWMVNSWGWRSAFVVMGALGLIWAAAWWLVYRSPDGAAPSPHEPRIPAGQLLRTRFMLTFTLSKFFMDPVWYFIAFWFPSFLSEVHGVRFTMQDMGWKAMIPFIAAAVGNVAGGAATGQLIRRGLAINHARKAGAALFALLMVGMIPAILTSQLGLAIALVSLAAFGYAGYTANTLAFPPEVFPKSAIASAWGLASVGSGLGGMLFSYLSGYLVQRVGYTPVFIGYGIFPLIALALVLWGLGPLRPHPRFSASASTP
ncbi:MAG: transporter, family, hexuronate transporter [Verrucomicrobiota bacterium]|nr:transporter, family, hexuronate transporter [Verrucomicrobiota bacterium]